ncbi:MAG: hypothetical protein ACLRPX_06870 [Ruthenibacterium sp.]
MVEMWLHRPKNTPPGPQNAALFFFQKFIGGFRIICSAFPSYLNQQHLKVAFQQQFPLAGRHKHSVTHLSTMA